MCVSHTHVLDSQLLNVWTYGHENCRVCSRTRSHDSAIFFRIFRINIFLVTASLVILRSNFAWKLLLSMRLTIWVSGGWQFGSAGPVHYIKIGYGRLSVQLWLRAEPINRDDRLWLPRANWLTTLVIIMHLYWNGHNLFVHQLLGVYLCVRVGGCPVHVGRNTYHCSA